MAKKSDDINKHYPMMGYRVKSDTKEAVERLLDRAISAIKNQSDSLVSEEKRNKVFVRALELGLNEIIKKKSL